MILKEGAQIIWLLLSDLTVNENHLNLPEVYIIVISKYHKALYKVTKHFMIT